MTSSKSIFSRRAFLQTSGSLVAVPAVSAVIAGCGDSDDDTSPLGANVQPELTARQAIDAIATGRLSAQAYVATLLARAEKLSGLGTLITLRHRARIT